MYGVFDQYQTDREGRQAHSLECAVLERVQLWLQERGDEIRLRTQLWFFPLFNDYSITIPPYFSVIPYYSAVIMSYFTAMERLFSYSSLSVIVIHHNCL